MINKNYVLDEAYYGKKPELLEIEKNLTVIKDGIKQNGSSYNPNKAKELRNIEKIIEKLFNFEDVRIAIEGNMNYLNLATVPIFYDKRIKLCDLIISETPDGMKYKSSKGKKFIVITNAKTILETPVEQLVGAILHEIGHNFYITQERYRFLKNCRAKMPAVKALVDFISTEDEGIDPFSSDSKSTKKFSALLKVLYKSFKIFNFTGNPNNKKETAFDRYIDDLQKEFDHYYDEDYLNSTKDPNLVIKAIIKVFSVLSKTINVVFFWPIMFLAKPLNSLNAKSFANGKFSEGLKDDYINEKFSDNFALSYGYGKDLSQFFYDMSKQDSDSIENSLYSKIIYEYLDGYLNLVVSYHIDCHPNDLNRLKFAKQKLEYELKNNKYISDEEKKQIKKDIDFIDNRLIKNPTKLMEKEKYYNQKYHFERNKERQMPDNEDIFDAHKKLANQMGYYDTKDNDAKK